MLGVKEGHGLTDLKKALVESSNPFFMNLSIRYEKDFFVDFLKSSSFGSKLCEDCYPHQFSPLIDDDWKYKNFGKELYKGDFINLGVGQGYMLTTPFIYLLSQEYWRKRRISVALFGYKKTK